jgi:hypothetical protein
VSSGPAARRASKPWRQHQPKRAAQGPSPRQRADSGSARRPTTYGPREKSRKPPRSDTKLAPDRAARRGPRQLRRRSEQFTAELKAFLGGVEDASAFLGAVPGRLSKGVEGLGSRAAWAHVAVEPPAIIPVGGATTEASSDAGLGHASKGAVAGPDRRPRADTPGTRDAAHRGSRVTARRRPLGADLGANRVEPCRSLATGGEPCGQLGTCERARSAVLTRKRSLVRTQYRPPASLLVRRELHGCDFTADVGSN